MMKSATLEEAARQKLEIMWRLLEADPILRALLVSRFLDDLESGFQDRRRLYEKDRPDQSYLEYIAEMRRAEVGL